MERIESNRQTRLHDSNTRSSLPIHGELPRTRAIEPYRNSKINNYKQRNRYHKYLYTIATIGSLLTPNVALAADVGGVSATANPIANSSGSVTNQAIQVLQGPYITNTYGDGISCQTATANFTPYITRTGTWQDPYEAFFNDPVYNMADNNDDNIPDSPGEILYYVPTRTGQKSTQNINIGFSATFSIPLDKKAMAQCKESVALHNEYRTQVIANKRLDFEIARLKNCGQMKKEGIVFHPKSPYYSVCADVMLINPPGVVGDLKHSITPNGNASDLKEISIGNNSKL